MPVDFRFSKKLKIELFMIMKIKRVVDHLLNWSAIVVGCQYEAWEKQVGEG